LGRIIILRSVARYDKYISIVDSDEEVECQKRLRKLRKLGAVISNGTAVLNSNEMKSSGFSKERSTVDTEFIVVVYENEGQRKQWYVAVEEERKTNRRRNSK
jgi:hypothetical protein